MPTQGFNLATVPASPWKNGGGSTREILSWPPGAGIDAFDWRVSVATIAAPGPFSAFEGVERSITLLSGDGVQLQGEGVDHRLATPLQPFAFSGDVALQCRLLGGPSTDFNVMARRAHGSTSVAVIAAAQPLPSTTHGLLLAACGAWQVNDQALTEGAGLWWADASQAWCVAPVATADARLLFVTYRPSAERA